MKEKIHEKFYYYGESPVHFGIFRRPTKSFSTNTLYIFIHGGYWKDRVDLDYFSPFVRAFTNRGYATWQIEYSRVTENHSAKDILHSVYQALIFSNELKQLEHLHFNQVVFVGHSVGAQLALWGG